ncbi:MAG: DEAD/DEAH box helicase [Pseudohongiellaceae bacterium]
MSSPQEVSFSELSLSPAVLQALETSGYERPSPIQAKTIPLLLAGRDVIGQAQTGTGKTAAFALPLLSKLDLAQKEPQVLVLAPTRELALQVAEAFETYGSEIRGLQVLAVYGGAGFGDQLQGLRRGCHVVVGTPGRVMDHMRRGTLTLTGLKTLVLDEADEMLRMGFIDDVQWILEQAPAERQICLFSATMPPPIRKIANAYLREPEHVTIEMKTVAAELIRQRYWPVRGTNKLDALTRILEVEDFSGTLIFVRTKTMAVDLADKLSARGFAAAALNGDMSQQLRETTVEKLRNGALDILVATDVAARGLDVERITHVINYDIPHDVETYVHRIGRTGRAGREGDAILFVAPREQRMLGIIERVTRKKIGLLELPDVAVINAKRSERFLARISATLAEGGLDNELQLLRRFQQEHNVAPLDMAAALARLLQGGNPLLLEAGAGKSAREARPESADAESGSKRPRRSRDADGAAEATTAEAPRRPARSRSMTGGVEEDSRPRRPLPPPDLLGPSEAGMERFRIEVGHDHGVKPNNIVGAIANEAGIDSKFMGRISIYDDFSLIDLPEGMPSQVFQHLKKVWVANRQLDISRFEAGGATAPERPARPPREDRPAFEKRAKPAVEEGRTRPFEKTGKPFFDKGSKPAFERSAKPAFAAGKKPAFAKGDNLGSGKGDQSGFSRGDKPRVGKGDKPGFSKSDKPSFSKGNKPSFSKGDKPGFNKSDKPSFSKSEKAGFSKGTNPGFSKGDKPSFSKGAKSGFTKGGKPAFGKPGFSKGKPSKAKY